LALALEWNNKGIGNNTTFLLSPDEISNYRQKMKVIKMAFLDPWVAFSKIKTLQKTRIDV
jgi:hypothetical protein